MEGLSINLFLVLGLLSYQHGANHVSIEQKIERIATVLEKLADFVKANQAALDKNTVLLAQLLEQVSEQSRRMMDGRRLGQLDPDTTRQLPIDTLSKDSMTGGTANTADIVAVAWIKAAEEVGLAVGANKAEKGRGQLEMQRLPKPGQDGRSNLNL
jgi:hypothetical protein